MANYAELEMGFNRRETGSYTVEFHFSLPDSKVEVRPVQGQVDVKLREIELQAGEDAVEYGTRLTELVFRDPDVRIAFL